MALMGQDRPCRPSVPRPLGGRCPPSRPWVRVVLAVQDHPSHPSIRADRSGRSRPYRLWAREVPGIQVRPSHPWRLVDLAGRARPSHFLAPATWGPGAPAGPLGPPGPGWRCRSANCLASLLTRASSASRRSDGDGLRGTLGLAARTLLAWLVGAPRLAVLLLGLRAMAASYMKGDVGYVRCVSRTNCAPQKHNGPLGITIPTGPSASHAMISATGIAAPQNESPGSAFQPGRTLPLIGGQSQGGKIEVTHQHSARGPRTPRRPRPTSGLPPSTIPRTSSPSHPTGGRPSSREIAWTSLTPNKWGQACVIA